MTTCYQEEYWKGLLGRITVGGSHWSTYKQSMTVFVSDAKVSRVQGMARKLRRKEHQNRHIITADTLRRLCGVRVPLSLALILAQLYTLSLYLDLARAEKRESSSVAGGSSIRSSRVIHCLICAHSARTSTIESEEPTLQGASFQPIHRRRHMVPNFHTLR